MSFRAFGEVLWMQSPRRGSRAREGQRCAPRSLSRLARCLGSSGAWCYHRVGPTPRQGPKRAPLSCRPQRTWVAGRAGVRRDLRTAPADVRQCDTNRRGSEEEEADGQPRAASRAGRQAAALLHAWEPAGGSSPPPPLTSPPGKHVQSGRSRGLKRDNEATRWGSEFA